MLSSFNWYLRRCIFCPRDDFLGQILLSCCTFVSILELFNTIPSGQLLPLCVTFLLLSFMCVLSWFNPFAVDGFQQGSCDLSQFASWFYIYIIGISRQKAAETFSGSECRTKKIQRASHCSSLAFCDDIILPFLHLGLWWMLLCFSPFWPSEEMMEMIVVWDAHVAEPQREISSM